MACLATLVTLVFSAIHVMANPFLSPVDTDKRMAYYDL